VIILATHKLVNKTDKPWKFQIGITTIKLEPYGEAELNLNTRQHIKRPVMRRALVLLSKYYPEELEVIALQTQINKKIEPSPEEIKKAEELDKKIKKTYKSKKKEKEEE
jgi:hypothetical protein